MHGMAITVTTEWLSGGFDVESYADDQRDMAIEEAEVLADDVLHDMRGADMATRVLVSDASGVIIWDSNG
jgi:hypothetical protein